MWSFACQNHDISLRITDKTFAGIRKRCLGVWTSLQRNQCTKHSCGTHARYCNRITLGECGVLHPSSISLSLCTLGGPVYTGWSSVHWNVMGMPLDGPVYAGISLGDPPNTCRVHWNRSGKTYLKLFHTGMPLEKLWLLQPTLEHHWRDCPRSLSIQLLFWVYCSAVHSSSALQPCEYFNITLCMLWIWAPL